MTRARPPGGATFGAFGSEAHERDPRSPAQGFTLGYTPSPLRGFQIPAPEGRRPVAQSETLGDPLPAMPVFLDRSTYVLAPLDETYMRTWEKCPREMKELIESPPAG